MGLGYSVISSKTEGLYFGQNQKSTGSEDGVNLNLGLSYDISKRFFLQVQYDYVRTKDDYNYLGNTIVIKQNLEYLKAGVGFRF
ncbi:hypothetical protein [Maribacter sp.]|uniref:outer membrane protein n=1 Tax=Maribacter sp. TaxID=1897614 RepID=UPI0025BA8B9B|nr:hypothetical protein [Maribacter sp.]